MDVPRLHATLCGQAAISEMLSRTLPNQRVRLETESAAYLHAARLLLEANGDPEARARTESVYLSRLRDHEMSWVK
jgi:hypothetical protein